MLSMSRDTTQRGFSHPNIFEKRRGRTKNLARTSSVNTGTRCTSRIDNVLSVFLRRSFLIQFVVQKLAQLTARGRDLRQDRAEFYGLARLLFAAYRYLRMKN